MATTAVAYRLPGGAVHVCYPAPRYVQQLRDQGLTNAQILTAITQRDVPEEAERVRVIDADTDLPAREFRAVWELADTDAAPVVRLPRARQYWLRVLRAALRLRRDAYRQRVADAEVDGDQAAADAARSEWQSLKAAVESAAVDGLTLAEMRQLAVSFGLVDEIQLVVGRPGLETETL